MTQFKIGQGIEPGATKGVKYPSDLFGIITLATSQANQYKIGEKVTGGTSGATAKVSGAVPSSVTIASVGTSLTITGGGTQTIVRQAGSWVSDGVLVGSIIKLTPAGSTLNTGYYAVTLVTALTLTCAGAGLVSETLTGGTLTGVPTCTNYVDLRVKSVVGGGAAGANFFSAAETITGAVSTLAVAAAGSNQWNFNQKSYRWSNGNPSTFGAVSYNTVTLDDRGFNVKTRSNSDRIRTPLTVAVRLAASKIQNTDTSVAPTFTYTIPAASGLSVAGKSLMRFIVASNEALTVTGGVPYVNVTLNGSTQTRRAVYMPTESDAENLVFDYKLNPTADVLSAAVANIGGTGTSFSFTLTKVDGAGAITTGATSGTITNAGSGLTAGTYTGVALTGGSGTGAIATITVTGSTVSSVNITTAGSGYLAADNTGTLAGASYTANGATITDVGGAAQTPTIPSVTGVTIGA